VLLEQMAEAQDGRLIRRRSHAEIHADKPLQNRRLVQRLFHAGVGQVEPLLHEVRPEHDRQAVGADSQAAGADSCRHAPTAQGCATHWSCRKLTAALAIGNDAVHRSWQEAGLKPHGWSAACALLEIDGGIEAAKVFRQVVDASIAKIDEIEDANGTAGSTRGKGSAELATVTD